MSDPQCQGCRYFLSDRDGYCGLGHYVPTYLDGNERCRGRDTTPYQPLPPRPFIKWKVIGNIERTKSQLPKFLRKYQDLMYHYEYKRENTKVPGIRKISVLIVFSRKILERMGTQEAKDYIESIFDYYRSQNRTGDFVKDKDFTDRDKSIEVRITFYQKVKPAYEAKVKKKAMNRAKLLLTRQISYEIPDRIKTFLNGTLYSITPGMGVRWF